MIDAQASKGDHAPILVVDDDPNLLQVVTLVLEHQGYSVITASNGQQALDLLRQQAPALILLDMRMPVLDGRGFMQQIGKLPKRPAPIILFSAAEDAQALAGELSADGFLEKPFDLVQLLDTVKRYSGLGTQGQIYQ